MFWGLYPIISSYHVLFNVNLVMCQFLLISCCSVFLLFSFLSQDLEDESPMFIPPSELKDELVQNQKSGKGKVLIIINIVAYNILMSWKWKP